MLSFSLSLYLYIYIHMYTYVYTYMYIHISKYIYIYTYYGGARIGCPRAAVGERPGRDSIVRNSILYCNLSYHTIV